MESKDEMPVKLLCMACLCFGRNLKELKDERLRQYYLDILNEVPLYSTLPVCPVVCWECEALLKRAISFREQCKVSYRILQTYTNENLNERLFTEVVSTPALTIQKREAISIGPDAEDIVSEGLFVCAGVKLEECSQFKGQVRNDLIEDDKPTDPQSDIFKEELKESETYIDESDILDITDDTNCSEKIVKKSSRQKSVMVKEERFNSDENALCDSDARQSDDMSRFVDIEVALKSLVAEKRVRRRKKLGKRKKRIRRDKENLSECPLSEELCQQLKPDKDGVIAMDSAGHHGVEGVFVDGGVKTEDGDCPELDDTDVSNANPSEDTHFAEIDVALKSLVGEKKDGRRETLSRVKGKKRVKRDRELKQKSTKILTVEMTYEEMLRERERELKRERYVKSEYRCEMCILGFSHEGAHREHNRRRHDKALGDYSCPVCKTVVPSVDAFTAHYKRHLRRYECALCRKRTVDLKVMQQHYYSRHEIALKHYECNVCGKVSKSIEAHRYHRDSHKARIQCPECEKTYRHRAGLMNHRVAVHEFRNAFPCGKCEKVFRWKTSLKRHLEKHDVKDASTPAPAFCSVCDVSFASTSSYQRHLKNSLKHVTQDQLKYICDHCDRRFADKTKLRDHIEEKHLFKTFQCHICLKPSKNRVGLDQHIRNVHKGRPYNAVCHFCGKRFPTRGQLESHVRTHTGERPFICEFCPTTFSQQSNLSKHNRQVHLNIKSKRFPMCKKRKEDRGLVAEENPTVGQTHPTPTAVWRYSPQRGIIM